MATKIRLRRVGRKGVPLYRIVVADKDSPRDGRFVATLGTYNPRAEQPDQKMQIDADAAKAWLAKGALPTDTVRDLLTRAGVLAAAPKA
ncbi:MAG: 30S ribosomal protein S16 [Gemmatimonadales bacterium]